MKIYFTFVAFIIILYSCSNAVKNNDCKDIDKRFMNIDSDPIFEKEKGGFEFYSIKCDTCIEDIYWYFHLFPNDSLILDFKDYHSMDYDSLEFYFNKELIYKTKRNKLVLKKILLVDSLINKNSFNYLKASAVDRKTMDTIELDLRVFVFFKDGIIKQKNELYPIW